MNKSTLCSLLAILLLVLSLTAGCGGGVNANVILHNSGEENMHDSGEKSLWVSFK